MNEPDLGLAKSIEEGVLRGTILQLTPILKFPFSLQALPHLSRLEEVNFGDCLVRNAGAEVLAEALTNGHQCLKVGVYSVVDAASLEAQCDLPVSAQLLHVTVVYLKLPPNVKVVC